MSSWAVTSWKSPRLVYSMSILPLRKAYALFWAMSNVSPRIAIFPIFSRLPPARHSLPCFFQKSRSSYSRARALTDCPAMGER